MQAYI